MTNEPTTITYATWTRTHFNEAFDRAQSLAFELTDADRAAGRPAPASGYSAVRFAEAKAIVRAAQEVE